jgi:hypothetical protein
MIPGRGAISSARLPFAFHEPWNDLTGRPEEDPASGNEEAFEQRLNAFEQS